MARIKLWLKEITASPLFSLLILVATAAASGLTAMILSIGLTIENQLLNDLNASIPPDIIRISPKSPEGGSNPFGLPAGRKPVLLSESWLRKLKRMKGVESVIALEASRIPMQAQLTFMGITYRTDLVCVGVPYAMIKDELDRGDRSAFRNWKPGDALPVLAPQIILDAYNNLLAAPNGLPRVNPEYLIGREFTLMFGRSSLKAINGFNVTPSYLAGFSRKIDAICLIVPEQALSYYHNKYDPKGETTYMNASVKIKSHEAYLDVQKKLKDWPFVVETRNVSKNLIEMKKKVSQAVTWFMSLVYVLALIAVGFSVLIVSFKRLDVYRIYRTWGASRFSLSMMLLFKTMLLGFFGTIIGLLMVKTQATALFQAMGMAELGFKYELPEKIWNLMLIAGPLLSGVASIPAMIRLATLEINTD